MQQLIQKGSDQLVGTVFDFPLEHIHIYTDYITIERFQRRYAFGRHMHSNYEFHCIAQGKGKVGILENTFDLEKGDFYITGPFVEHWQEADAEDPMVEYCIRFDVIRKEEDATKFNRDVEMLIQIMNEKTRTVIKDQYNIENRFNQIFVEAAEEKIGYQQVITKEIIGILYAAARNFHDQPSAHLIPKLTLKQHRLQRIERYIFDNVYKKLTYEEIANYMFLSKRQTERIVKEGTGKSLHQLIVAIKVERAIFHLENSYRKLKEVAELTGFSNEFHLSRTIKKVTGKNPSDYREKETKGDR